MATRLHYVLPAARRFAVDSARRLRRGGLASRLPATAGPPFVIVTGAGRSGTSAVARVLHESGITMGGELGEASEHNPEGFYEDMGVWWVNEQLLTELGMAGIWQTERWPWRSTVLAAARRYGDEMARLAREAEGGWKDPRFSVTLEAWLPHLPSRPKVVVCLRSPRAYAESAVRIFGLVDRAACERQWARHYRRLLDVIRDYELEATCIEYDSLIERPEETVAALAGFAGRPLRAEYVNPPLRHHAHIVPERYVPLYREALALAGEGAPSLALAREADGAAGAAASIAAGDYIALADELESLLERERPLWTERVGMPSPDVASEDARQATATYAAALHEAQERLRAVDPPPAFERYHELATQTLDAERMVAELTLAAGKDGEVDGRVLKLAVRAWRKFADERPFAKARAQRHRERERAVAATEGR